MMVQLFRPERIYHFYVDVISDDAHVVDIKRVIASRIVIMTSQPAVDYIKHKINNLNNDNNEKKFSNAPRTQSRC